MSPRKPPAGGSAPLGTVAASWLAQARLAAPWTPDELRALEVAAQHLDRAEKARDQVEAEGMTTVNSRGAVVGHPLLSFEVSNRAAWAKLCRELGLIGVAEARDPNETANELARVRAINSSLGARMQRGQA